MEKVYYKKLVEHAKIPERAHVTDAGYDCFVAYTEKTFTELNGGYEQGVRCYKNFIKVFPGGSCIIPTGLAVQLPKPFTANLGNRIAVDEEVMCNAVFNLSVIPRSGRSHKDKMIILNSPGTVDSGYTGQIGVIIHNLKNEFLIINQGEKICQFKYEIALTPEHIEVSELNKTDRGSGGFGHTGK